MDHLGKLKEIVETYARHGWRVRRALLRAETSAGLQARPEIAALLNDASVSVEAAFDALWFARPSHQGREAWELRLVGDSPYALFETFEPDEAEEDREDVRREMEARLREYAEGRR
jgi:hypothetical protein